VHACAELEYNLSQSSSSIVEVRLALSGIKTMLPQAPSKPLTVKHPFVRYCAHITSVGKSASHSQSSPFSLLYYNARSLFPKMDCLHALMSIHKPDAICIVETWLCPDITAVEISLPGYSAVRLDRDRHGGGIILFVADIYNVKVLQQGPLDLEFLLVSVQCAQFKLSLAVLY